MSWRIYYEDGSTFDALDGDPEDAPGHGVLCIVQPCEAFGRQVVSGWDFYYYRSSSVTPWWGGDLIGTIDQFVRHPRESRALKMGSMADTPDYQRIRKAAIDDPDFRPMSGGGQGVVRPRSNSRGQT